MNPPGWLEAPDDTAFYVRSFVKEVDKKRRTTVGILSAQLVDRANEIVDQDSLDEHLGKFIERSGIVVFNHGWAGGIGRCLDKDRVKGTGDVALTYVKCEYGEGYSLPVSTGPFGGTVALSVDDIWKQIEQGILRTHSHAFNAKREKTGKSEDAPTLLTVTDLFEVSVVTVPALPVAVFEVAKAARSTRRSVTAEIDELERLREEVAALRSEEAALRAIIEARRALCG